MNFHEALQRLDQRQEHKMRLELRPMQAVLELFGRPDRSYSSVVVGGTNGKGSICAYVSEMARRSGVRVGTYLSPHITNVTERIWIDGNPIEETLFADLVQDTEDRLARARFEPLTYFEFLTLIALRAFERVKTDFAVLEIGLGGRLDSVNAVERIGSALASIDYDHMQLLGTTLEEIAFEKAHIMRPNQTCVSVAQHPNVIRTLQHYANEHSARLAFPKTDYVYSLREGLEFEYRDVKLTVPKLGIRGAHQAKNAACALALATELKKLGIGFHISGMISGLAKARLPGRLEKWVSPEGKEIWLDMAHNPAAISCAVDYLMQLPGMPTHVVLGMLADKDWLTCVKRITESFPELTICVPESPRAWNPAEALAHALKQADCAVVPNPVEAVRTALQTFERIVCLGSVYTIGPIRNHLMQNGFEIAST